MGDNDDLFRGLPPPSEPTVVPSTNKIPPSPIKTDARPPPPVLKSVLKRNISSQDGGKENQKRLRFKTTTDATASQVVEAMQKIASHIKNPAKFAKASKLAVQLVQAGSVREGTSDLFFSILDAAMISSPGVYSNPSLRADYQELFSAAQNVKEFLSEKQQNCLTTWTMMVMVGNDLHTDDSFVFSKASGKIKDAISSLPFATENEDAEEEITPTCHEDAEEEITPTCHEDSDSNSCDCMPEKNNENFDPFGLDALLPGRLKKEERTMVKKKGLVSLKEKTGSAEETKRFMKAQREAIILCLETAARRYKTPWAQTMIDILVKHSYDNVSKFTCHQRDAITKLWNSIREQQIRRKQGKSVTGKLDMNAFESLQEKYAHAKMSIRHSVGGAGERRAQQWLG